MGLRTPFDNTTFSADASLGVAATLLDLWSLS
jgi:hypothetical protein